MRGLTSLKNRGVAEEILINLFLIGHLISCKCKIKKMISVCDMFCLKSMFEKDKFIFNILLYCALFRLVCQKRHCHCIKLL